MFMEGYAKSEEQSELKKTLNATKETGLNVPVSLLEWN